MPVAFSNRVRSHDSVIIRTFEDGESVLLHMETEYYFGLNAVGTRMWQTLTQSDSIEEAFHTLLAEYDVDAKDLHRDLSQLLDTLIEQRLLNVIEPTAQ